MSIAKGDQLVYFGPKNYDVENGLVETVDIAGKKISVSLDEIPEDLRMKILDAEKKAS